MELTNQQRELFLEELWGYYGQRARTELPWRQPNANGTFNPYKIMVSELMLQQTQVARVIPKYQEFLAQFSTVQVLAVAELGDVLRAWQGLGYNRRAKFLWQAAQQVAAADSFPSTTAQLVQLPGVGVNTAGAIMAYAYNQPVTFIETNVRTVYIHHFFTEQEQVADKAIAELVTQTVSRENPREFYWALMDYGSHLKASVGNVSVASKHYAKQSRFEGSRRQVRGRIIRMLGAGPHTEADITLAVADARTLDVLQELTNEQMIRMDNGRYSL